MKEGVRFSNTDEYDKYEKVWVNQFYLKYV